MATAKSDFPTAVGPRIRNDECGSRWILKPAKHAKDTNENLPDNPFFSRHFATFAGDESVIKKEAPPCDGASQDADAGLRLGAIVGLAIG